MNRFHSGSHSRGFSQLLRSAGHKGVQIPVDNSQPGAMPEQGGSAGNRTPNNAATQKFMDAKNSAGHQPGLRRRAGKATSDKPGVRIAEGSAGTSGRTIHHKTIVKPAHEVPAHISIGAKRSGTSSQKLSSSGTTKMSTEVERQHGVPAHESVINRGIKPKGGYKHSRARTMNMAHKLAM